MPQATAHIRRAPSRYEGPTLPKNPSDGQRYCYPNTDGRLWIYSAPKKGWLRQEDVLNPTRLVRVLPDEHIPAGGKSYDLAALDIDLMERYCVNATPHFPARCFVEKGAAAFVVKLVQVTGAPATGNVDISIMGY